MKKTIIFIVFTLVLAISCVSTASTSPDTTIIAGKIYNAEYTGTIAGADVEVTCNGNVQTITSASDGAYSVQYPEDVCHEGNSLSVYAEKDGLTGYKEGEIHDDYPMVHWNLAVVNVPLVPEFGVVVGGLTVLGALGLFFLVRKKY